MISHPGEIFRRSSSRFSVPSAAAPAWQGTQLRSARGRCSGSLTRPSPPLLQSHDVQGILHPAHRRCHLHSAHGILQACQELPRYGGPLLDG